MGGFCSLKGNHDPKSGFFGELGHDCRRALKALVDSQVRKMQHKLFGSG